MAILVDSNILLDLAEPDSEWASWSARALIAAGGGSDLLMNVVVSAEVAYGFRSEAAFLRFVSNVPIVSEAIPGEAGWRAAEAHKLYRARGGTRERTLPDFLIGAHAAIRGYRILTRDPSGYRAYFPGLDIIAPDTHP